MLLLVVLLLVSGINYTGKGLQNRFARTERMFSIRRKVGNFILPLCRIITTSTTLVVYILDLINLLQVKENVGSIQFLRLRHTTRWNEKAYCHRISNPLFSLSNCIQSFEAHSNIIHLQSYNTHELHRNSNACYNYRWVGFDLCGNAFTDHLIPFMHISQL